MATRWNFDRGLAIVDRLTVLAETPLLRVAADALPPGNDRIMGRPSTLTKEGLLIVGAATVLFGSDRRADAELDAQWPLLRPRLRAAGIPVPVRPPTAQAFRYWRDTHLQDPAVLDDLKAALLPVYIGMAKDMGFFGDTSEAGWLEHLPYNTLLADGSWWRPASEVGHPIDKNGTTKRSRTRYRTPRVVEDADVRGNAFGYCHVMVFAQGVNPRERIVFTIDRAPGGNEMDNVVPTVLRLREMLGDGLRHFIYDGAMAGVHHHELHRSGLLTVNKPKGLRSLEQWRSFQGSRIAKNRIMRIHTHCTHDHRVDLAAGMFWVVGTDQLGRPVRSTVVEHRDVRRLMRPDGGFRFELDLVTRCPEGDHILTVDPSAERYKLDRRWLNLAEQLRTLPMNLETFGPVYGLRNSSESDFSHMKHFLGLGTRAGSYTVERHELDLILTGMIHNAADWLEHGRRGRRAA